MGNFDIKLVDLPILLFLSFAPQTKDSSALLNESFHLCHSQLVSVKRGKLGIRMKENKMPRATYILAFSSMKFYRLCFLERLTSRSRSRQHPCILKAKWIVCIQWALYLMDFLRLNAKSHMYNDKEFSVSDVTGVTDLLKFFSKDSIGIFDYMIDVGTPDLNLLTS